ncbi:MAG TPA: hypothetical protein VID27_05350, partial [Blastocatellia bacterium]
KTGTTGSRPVQAATLPAGSQPVSPSVSAQHGTIQFGSVSTNPDAAPIPAPSGEHLKETRLGAGSTVPPAFPNQAKETRLPDPVPQAYATRPEQYYQAGPQRASLFARLNWKHYAGAGAALLVLLIVPFAIIAGLKRNQPEASPVQQQSSPAPTVQAEEQPQAPQTQDQIAPLPSQEAGAQPSDPTNGAAKPARPRDNSNTKAEQPPDYAETTPPPTTAAPPPQPPPTEKSETSVPPRETEKKEVAKKEEPKKEEEKKEKKKGGFGGFLKKVFGGGDDKKNEKKKKP